MKKTKKIVSTILGLLSAFSFKSSALDIDIDDDDDDEFTYDVDYGLDNQNIFNLGNKMATGVPSIITLLLVIYGLYSKFSKKEFDTGRQLLTLYSERLTKLLKRDIINSEKEQFTTKFPKLKQFLYDDLLIMSIVCNYCAAENLQILGDYAVKGEFLGFGKLIGELNCSELLRTGDEYVVERVLSNLSELATTDRAKQDHNTLSLAIAVLKSFAELGYLKQIDGDNIQAKNDDSMEIAKKAVNLIKVIIDEKITKISKADGEEKFKTYMSYILCALGLPIWNQLYPNKKEYYDEKEYLRLQKQLCIMLPLNGGACR